MTIIIFIFILALLVFIHELGHFLVAKKSGVRVDEFAIGFPPTLYSKQIGETKYSINMIPFGGYVKIFGEDYDSLQDDPDKARSFVYAKRWKQALIIVAGVAFNILLAWPFFTLSFWGGYMALSQNKNFVDNATSKSIVILNTLPGSPAEKAGFKGGEEIIALKSVLGEEVKDLTVEKFQSFISSRKINESVVLTYLSGKQTLYATVTPSSVSSSSPKMLGVGLAEAVKGRLPFFTAVYEGFIYTFKLFYFSFINLAMFIGHAIIGQANFSQVSGPVGLAKMVGTASSMGWAQLFNFIGVISVSLAALNLFPFPALDGGRLIFIGIEAIIRRPIKPMIAVAVNAVGFLLLITLMVVVTVKDIIKLF
jgi:regulator of sigma E protease